MDSFDSHLSHVSLDGFPANFLAYPTCKVAAILLDP